MRKVENRKDFSHSSESFIAMLRSTKKISFLALLLATALILSYLESLIPIPVPVPGVKLGLANIVTLLLLETLGFFPALILIIMRVFISGFLFGSMSSILYALGGGVLSVLVMNILIRIQKDEKIFSLIFISIIGAIANNCGQLIVAPLVIQNAKLIAAYFPFLILLAIPTGLIVGLLTQLLIRSVKTNFLI